MKVRVLVFAQLRELAGTAQMDVELGDGATVADLLREVYAQKPMLRAHDRSTLIGAGVEFVGRDYVIRPGDEISIMPPVQGG
jgi:molybdopterin converting factor small subunit